MRKMGMYIHIPFCKSKCDYCDFSSWAGKEKLIPEYMKWLKVELAEVANGIMQDVTAKKTENIEIRKIYIGGGTPSSIDSKYILEMLTQIRKQYRLADSTEITIEINPGTICEKKLQDYQKAGINRISIGLQSTHNHHLQNIGRIHTFEDFLYTYELARKCGFNNINVDLIIGLPQETIGEVKEDIEKIAALQPEHISVYSLILEEGTKLYQKKQQNKISLPTEEEERAMYWLVKNNLEQHGYRHYEISNFAKAGFESKHNLDCWSQKEYIGFGAAAHSYTEGCRYANIDNIETYIQNYQNQKEEDNIIIHEKQDKTSMAKEFILLGLRTIYGCEFKDFEEKFGYDLKKGFQTELQKLEKQGLIEINQSGIRLSSKGLDLANLVWEEFV